MPGRTRLRDTFEESASLYQKARPAYPAELFDDLVTLTNVVPPAELLAVGGGGGGETELGPEDPYAAQVGYFLRCITDKEPPVLSDAVSAIRALQVSLAARESLSSGGAVMVKPFA